MTTELTSNVRNGTTYHSYINYSLKGKVSIAFQFQLCSIRYTALLTNNCLKKNLAIKVATMKIMNDFHYIMCYHQISQQR